VGYKELFEYFDGNWDLDFAKNMIKQNSRRYAKKQLTWFNRDKDINWFRPDQREEILSFLKSRLRE
jgi:tRNA dimethylallyltransferase